MSLTPEQFNKLVIKEDLKELEERLNAKIDKKIDQVLSAVDGIAKKHKNFEAELAANQGAHDRFEERIKSIEKKQGLTQFT